ISKGAGKFALESVVPSDVIGRVFTGFRTLAETPTISDAASRVFTGIRSTSENLGSAISDVVTKGVTKSISEVVSIAVSVSKGAGKFPLLSVVPSDVVGRVFTGFRSTSENLGSAISDVVTKGVTKSISEVVSIAVSVSKGAGKFPLLSVVPSDVVGRVFTGFRSTSENLGSAISDVVTKGATRSLSEVVSIAVSLSKGAGKFPLLSVVPSDVVGRVFTGFRSTSENLSTISDVVTKGATSSLSEVVSIAVSVSKAAAKFALESVVPSDVVGRVFTGFRTLTETPTISAAASRVFTGFRTTSENLASAITDVVNKGVVKSLSEVVSVSDVVSRVFTGFRTLTEPPTISAAASRVFTGFRTTSEDLSSTI